MEIKIEIVNYGSNYYFILFITFQRKKTKTKTKTKTKIHQQKRTMIHCFRNTRA